MAQLVCVLYDKYLWTDAIRAGQENHNMYRKAMLRLVSEAWFCRVWFSHGIILKRFHNFHVLHPVFKKHAASSTRSGRLHTPQDASWSENATGILNNVSKERLLRERLLWVLRLYMRGLKHKRITFRRMEFSVVRLDNFLVRNRDLGLIAILQSLDFGLGHEV